MNYPLLRYYEVLANAHVQPMTVSGVLSVPVLLKAHSDQEAVNHIKESLMQQALVKAAAKETDAPIWEVSQRHDGLHFYSEFYILTQQKLGKLLDAAYLLGRSDAPREMV